MDIFQQRLNQEFGADVIFTSPTVLYKVRKRNFLNIKINYKDSRGTQYLSSINDFPEMSESPKISSVEEPMIRLSLIIRHEDVGPILSSLLERRGIQQDMSIFDATQTLIIFRMPLSEIIVDFFDTVQSITSGFIT